MYGFTSCVFNVTFKILLRKQQNECIIPDKFFGMNTILLLCNLNFKCVTLVSIRFITGTVNVQYCCVEDWVKMNVKCPVKLFLALRKNTFWFDEGSLMHTHMYLQSSLTTHKPHFKHGSIISCASSSEFILSNAVKLFEDFFMGHLVFLLHLHARSWSN